MIGHAAPVTACNRSLPRMTLVESLALLAAAGGPLFAKGIMVRRPWVVRLLQATGLEASGVRALQRARRRYGDGPVMLRLPFRDQAVVLSADDVKRVLRETPKPFQSDSSEKHATLAHFEPRGSLISRGPERARRRAFNEAVLETGCPMHGLAPRFAQVVAAEMGRLLAAHPPGAKLAWGAFKDAWFRTVRRCLFGDRAADDKELTQALIKLRGRANWAFLLPKRKALRSRFLAHVSQYLQLPEPDSLAALATERAAKGAAAENQIAQWLFAFDAAGIATFRALAVIASSEALTAQAAADREPELPFLRACLLEAVRLWPTTPAILRQTDRATTWDHGTMPAGTGVLIHVPFLHRDDERLPFAHRFAPELWLNGEAARWGLVPFSAGSGECPARNLVLLLASMTLRALLEQRRFALPARRKLDPAALPATFDQFSLSLLTRAAG
jgi:cytochrome P450